MKRAEMLQNSLKILFVLDDLLIYFCRNGGYVPATMQVPGQRGLPDSRCDFWQALEYCWAWQAICTHR